MTDATGNNLTVAICVKNGGRTIRNAVQSIARQRTAPRRLLVVNDGSTDDTLAEVEGAETGALTVTVIPCEGNGLYDGRNTALKHCDTEFLAFIDADCEADPLWTTGLLSVFAHHPDVAAGTGPHPQIGAPNWVSRMHRLWFVVEGYSGQCYASGAVGANSFFRTSVLRKVGGWISLPLGNAEDMYICEMIKAAGHKIWFDENVKVYHHYTRDFGDFMRKTCNSGYAIVVMMRNAHLKNIWFYYTLAIPLIALITLVGIAAGIMGWDAGWALVALLLALSFAFDFYRFKTATKTVPRWIVRWVIIWSYSLGIVKALLVGDRKFERRP